jgi:hypothetical protein
MVGGIHPRSRSFLIASCFAVRAFHRVTLLGVLV